VSIKIKNLCFAYGERKVLRDVNFSANSGELVCVLGPNGVGKSTLFRCMLGLQNSYKGDISVNGQEIGSMPAAVLAKKIAYIPQHYSMYFNYTVFHMVLMGTTSQISTLASPGKAQEHAVMQALERFGIAHLRDRGCAQISGGERQLALIARAVVQQAKILVMDEPTANLDYGNQFRVMQEVCRLAQQGYTIILSTHNPEQALMYANRVLVLLDGTVLRFGTPDEVMSNELLHKVYGVNVQLREISLGQKKMRVCIPLEQLEEQHVLLE